MLHLTIVTPEQQFLDVRAKDLDQGSFQSLAALDGMGRKVIVHDPLALEGAREVLSDRVALAPSLAEAVAAADAVVLMVADEPYRLSLYLPGPPPCFCQLSLMPEAGGSIVTLDLTPAEDAELPDPPAVRDLLVSELNRLAGSARR